jgi:hypothetical protein
MSRPPSPYAYDATAWIAAAAPSASTRRLLPALLVSGCPRRHFADRLFYILALETFLPLTLLQVALMSLAPTTRENSVSDLHRLLPLSVLAEDDRAGDPRGSPPPEHHHRHPATLRAHP